MRGCFRCFGNLCGRILVLQICLVTSLSLPAQAIIDCLNFTEALETGSSKEWSHVEPPKQGEITKVIKRISVDTQPPTLDGELARIFTTLFKHLEQDGYSALANLAVQAVSQKSRQIFFVGPKGKKVPKANPPMPSDVFMSEVLSESLLAYDRRRAVTLPGRSDVLLDPRGISILLILARWGETVVNFGSMNSNSHLFAGDFSARPGHLARQLPSRFLDAIDSLDPMARHFYYSLLTEIAKVHRGIDNDGVLTPDRVSQMIKSLEGVEKVDHEIRRIIDPIFVEILLNLS